MKSFESELKRALQAEKDAFPQPSQNLRKRLLALRPEQVKRIAWRTVFGFAATVIILMSICVDRQREPRTMDDYFKPTQVVDLNELSFEPTKTIYLEN